ncbi:PhzF family phenazine biosynthesis protein [Rossellomorea marisflavi]|uniref:PhzF family phenazine biosynthesis protein n=1 Tax=Rossellomorea marisflavi TaxID=189381 RepID=UPI00207A0A80|nr:PhzF family phenazine biosynthesis protein [Rossellomorea marisflavi]USK92909.1 PhzF family phenazine biosynthesis protein [Rossellomorea marisflavi]
MTILLYQYDAFTKEINKGNPAGIVLNADTIPETDMQNLAYKLGYNETTFVGHSSIADFKLRYFTPGQEMDLCGHGTIAAVQALEDKDLLNQKEKITIETRAGVLPIWLARRETLYITMQQNTAEFIEFTGDRSRLSQALGIEADELSDDLPIVFGSTGNWTLIVPVKSLESFLRMKPDNERFPSILTQMPKASIHPICSQTFNPNADLHGRHFSSPYSGTEEDPVTGTASGVMGAYYATYIHEGLTECSISVEQGNEIGKSGMVGVTIKQNGPIQDVFICGTAVLVKEIGENAPNKEPQG